MLSVCVQIGDRLLQVNRVDVTAVPHDAAVQAIHYAIAQRSVALLIARSGPKQDASVEQAARRDSRISASAPVNKPYGLLRPACGVEVTGGWGCDGRVGVVGGGEACWLVRLRLRVTVRLGGW